MRSVNLLPRRPKNECSLNHLVLTSSLFATAIIGRRAKRGCGRSLERLTCSLSSLLVLLSRDLKYRLYYRRLLCTVELSYLEIAIWRESRVNHQFNRGNLVLMIHSQ